MAWIIGKTQDDNCAQIRRCPKCQRDFLSSAPGRPVCIVCKTRICPQCNKSFVIDLRRGGAKRKFCSRSCASRWNALHNPIIRANFEEGKKSPIRTQAISRALLGKPRWDLRGERSPHWKGGVNRSASQDIRRGANYREWRQAVYERDDYTCQRCGVRGGELNAHHIQEYADYPGLRFSVENGETLCVSCHKEHHYG